MRMGWMRQVVGAGRGPLVRASLAAAARAGRRLRVYAVEKNPNAVVTLHNLVATQGCGSLFLLPNLLFCSALSTSQGPSHVACCILTWKPLHGELYKGRQQMWIRASINSACTAKLFAPVRQPT